jgi:hypothetical protein
VPAASLTLTAAAPAVTITSPNIVVVPAATLQLSAAPPSITAGQAVAVGVSEGARGGGGWPWRTRRWWDDDEEPEPYTWPWERQEKRPAAPAEEPEEPPAKLPPDELVAKIERHRAVVAAAKLLVQQRMHDIDVAGEELLLLEAAERKLNEDEAMAVLMLDEI